MAVNLDRLLKDICGTDEDMKVLALTTLTQHDMAAFETQKDTLLRIREELLRTADHQKGETHQGQDPLSDSDRHDQVCGGL